MMMAQQPPQQQALPYGQLNSAAPISDDYIGVLLRIEGVPNLVVVNLLDSGTCNVDGLRRSCANGQIKTAQDLGFGNRTELLDGFPAKVRFVRPFPTSSAVLYWMERYRPSDTIFQIDNPLLWAQLSAQSYIPTSNPRPIQVRNVYVKYTPPPGPLPHPHTPPPGPLPHPGPQRLCQARHHLDAQPAAGDEKGRKRVHEHGKQPAPPR